MIYEVIKLPIELTNGNEGRTKTYKKSSAQRKQYERDIRIMFGQRKPFDSAVEVDVIRVLGKGQKFWDSSSILRGNYKEIEDAMVACGWYHDDSYKWIRHTRGYQDAMSRDQGPMVELRISATSIDGVIAQFSHNKAFRAGLKEGRELLALKRLNRHDNLV